MPPTPNPTTKRATATTVYTDDAEPHDASAVASAPTTTSVLVISRPARRPTASATYPMVSRPVRMPANTVPSSEFFAHAGSGYALPVSSSAALPSTAVMNATATDSTAMLY